LSSAGSSAFCGQQLKVAIGAPDKPLNDLMRQNSLAIACRGQQILMATGARRYDRPRWRVG
jgi:hypothetical protein